MGERTLINLFEESVRRHSGNILMWEKREGEYRGKTYGEIREAVHLTAAGLMSLGIKKGDRVALLSEGRNDWVISELAIFYCGGINVPISVKLEQAEELKFRLIHSGARFIIASGRQSPKVFRIHKDLPDLEHLILMDPVEGVDRDTMLLRDLQERGREWLKSNFPLFSARWQSVGESDPANICYTSGTTADPKGVVLTHLNYFTNVEQASAFFTVPEDYTSLLILPWDHSFAHTAGIYTLIRNGASMSSVELGRTYMETLRNIPQNIKETRPTILLVVPALLQSFRKNIERAVEEKGALAKRLFDLGLRAGYIYNNLGFDRGRSVGQRAVKPLYNLVDKLVFSKVREGFGGRLEYFVGGGAYLDLEMQRFFYAIGIPVYQGYGLTEASPIVSANTPQVHKLGTSGRVMPGLEIRIVDEEGRDLPKGHRGEIVVRGNNVMKGYWKNEKATAEALRDGWLFTGDLGYLDEDDFLSVLGRVKSLLIGDDGEKFSPEGIEESIVSNSPYIDQVMLYNSQSPYTSALVVPNWAALREWASGHKLPLKSQDGQRHVINLIHKEIQKHKELPHLRHLFPSKWMPVTFALLAEPFTEENGFINSTLKMVRSRITEYYRDRINYLYTPEGKDIYNHRNMNIVSRMAEG
ncbi:MAG: AMP-dependent synthetase/ligase [bacterium]